ncbi:MAG: hypothetical protein RIT43_696 [Bacteroidota bacterium]|jgi:hypothetical protein
MDSSIQQALGHLEPISLLEMDRVKLMNRVDTKFAFSKDQLLVILPELVHTYRILEIENTRCPFYESLYLDDEAFKFFRDHHNGRTNRFKVRFRKYVESNLTFLEIKHKIKGRTDKKRVKVDEIPDVLNQNHLDFIRNVLQSEHQLNAVLWNSFHRLTLVNKFSNERLTLDFDLKFRWNEESIHFSNLIIAELKQETVDRSSPFFQLMKSLGIRPYRLSKYCIGSIELYGNRLKFNRFKRKLLQLKKINAYAA